MRLVRFLALASLVVLPSCKKEPTVADYVREHRADLEAYVAALDEAKAHLADAGRTPRCEPPMSNEERKDLTENSVLFARDALVQPGGKVPPWSASIASMSDMLAGKVTDGDMYDPASMRRIQEYFEWLKRLRFLLVAEPLPSRDPKGWHGIALLWDLRKHEWRAAEEVEWSSVSRTAVSQGYDRLDERSETEIGPHIRAELLRRCTPLPPLPPVKKK